MARRSKSCTVMALRLSREVDARGKPFALHLARCNQWPRGLDLGLMDSGFQGPRYCVDTLRDTGDMREAMNAHNQRHGGRSNWAGWQRGGRGGGGWDRDDTPVVATEWIPPTNWFQGSAQDQPAQGQPAQGQPAQGQPRPQPQPAQQPQPQPQPQPQRDPRPNVERPWEWMGQEMPDPWSTDV